MFTRLAQASHDWDTRELNVVLLPDGTAEFTALPAWAWEYVGLASEECSAVSWTAAVLEEHLSQLAMARSMHEYHKRGGMAELRAAQDAVSIKSPIPLCCIHLR